MALNQINDTLQKEIERFSESYIFVNTNFKRKNEPIFMLAFLENKRYLSLSGREDFYYKSTNEILKFLSKEIVKHYKENKGELLVWGKIVTYQVHLFDKTYVYDPDGMLIDKCPNSENKAILKL